MAATMNTRFESILRTARNFGPYLLVELLLPGGTLIAILLWLLQHAGKRQNMKARERRTSASAAVLRLLKSAAPSARLAVPGASGALTLQQQPDDLRNDRCGALIELCRRQICDGMRHRQEAKIRQTPGARHRAARDLENVGDDRRRGNAVLFKYYAVEHTARAA